MYRKFIGLLFGILLLVSGSAVSAKENDKVTISGDTLAQDVVIEGDTCLLNALSEPNLEDVTTMTRQPPADLGASFLITRYMQTGDTTYQPFEHLRYYLDPVGGIGYVNYLGLADNSSSAYDGMWFRPTAPTDAIIKVLIGQPPPNLPDRAVISSRSLPHDLTISSDVCTLTALAAGNLDDPTLPVSQPPTVEGSGYLVTRYVGGQPYDQARFYRDPRGGRAYVLDLGRVDGGASDTAGQWYRPSLLSQTVIDGLLLNPSGYNGQP